jgi:hypothetical protein
MALALERRCFTFVGAEAERLGDVGRRQLLDLPQDQHRAVRLRQLVHELLQEVIQLGADEALLGGGVHGGLLLEHLGSGAWPATVAAESLQRLVDADPQEPGGEARAVAELRQSGEGQNVRLLHQLLDLVLVPNERADGPVEPLVVPPHQQLEGLDIAGEHAVDQGLVRRARLPERERVGRRRFPGWEWLEGHGVIHRMHGVSPGDKSCPGGMALCHLHTSPASMGRPATCSADDRRDRA